MNEVEIKFNLNSPQAENKPVIISVGSKPEEGLLFKFMVGLEGTWQTLRDFGEETEATWIPKQEGKYLIMIEARRKDSTKPFDYVSKTDYIIGQADEELIKGIYLDKNKLKVGDKISITVETAKGPAVFRYWIKEKDKWELVKDYSADNTLTWSVKSSGTHEILVESKMLDSKNKHDDMKKVGFEVVAVKRLEITNFECLTTNILAGNELTFQVDASYEDKRMILYKFVKICPDGTAVCIQDYSTKRMVSYVENERGSYKLLCLAKDMYSPKEFDDRALFHFVVKPYNDIEIQSLSSDLSSPQMCETPVLLKAVVKGGRELLYRFMIDGNNSEDSGFIRQSQYLWETKKAGKYKIILWVKDISYKGNYEVFSSIDFTIDEQSKFPVTIKEVIIDKKDKLLVDETVNIKAIASGGTDLRYSFRVKKDDKLMEKIDYGTCNWVNFTPENKGNYELEILVKDKYSKREYDAHYITYIEVYDYIPANIDYILMPSKEYYVVGDVISFNIITQNTFSTSLKYVLKINGHEVEEIDYTEDKCYSFIPKYSGQYEVEIYAKNIKSKAEFDCKKDVVIMINEALPVTNTKIQCDKTKIRVNEPVTFSIICEGGKEVEYEFYIMERGEWSLVQRYSRKDFYSYITFSEGNYKILALVKSRYKKSSYEDYDVLEFNVE